MKAAFLTEEEEEEEEEAANHPSFTQGGRKQGGKYGFKNSREKRGGEGRGVH